MTAPLIKGYCPGALRPMMSGDGLVVRVRPFAGRLTVAQATGIATLSDQFGNGIIDLSARANVQLRGVTSDSHGPLIDGLRALDLIDASEGIERRRNLIVTPFWENGDQTKALADRLTEALSTSDAPDLPHKFGFAIDTGPQPVLQAASADIRLERGHDGTLLLIAANMPGGQQVSTDTCIDAAMSLARWFMTTRRDETRMAALLHTTAPPPGFTSPRQNPHVAATPGSTPQGTLCGFAFGQTTSETFAQLAAFGPLRLTPWRMILVEGASVLPSTNGIITDPADPLLRITACTGAPGCTQAQGDTRHTARSLAPHLKPRQTLHISGCAKGCAHPNKAPLTLTATRQGFNLIHAGRAGDPPAATALSTQDIIKAL